MNHLGTCRPEPAYVERGGEIAFRLPYCAEGTRVHFFFVEADEARIRWHLERTYNQPSGGAVSLLPAGPYILLSFVKIKSLTSGMPDAVLGRVPEKEAAIWVPALQSRPGPDRLVWTVPYMFVDSGQAMASGREVSGYPKQLGTFEMKDLPDGTPDRLCVETLSLRLHRPNAIASPEWVVKVRRSDPHAPGRPRTHEDLDGIRNRLRALAPDTHEVIWFIQQLFGAGEAARDPALRLPSWRARAEAVQNRIDLAEVVFRLYKDLIDRKLAMVLLKQFRSATDPQRACYQAILEVIHRLVELRDWVLHGDEFDISFNVLASQHMQEELGVSSGTQKAAMAVTVDFDFEVKPARVLWQAPTD